MAPIPNTTVHWSFMLTNVHARVNRIQDNVRSWEFGKIEKELTACDALLFHLEQYAILHGVAIAAEQLRALTAMKQTMLDIEDRLRTLKQPWWAKCANVFVKAVNILSNLIGIGSIVPMVSVNVKGFLRDDRE